MTSARRFSFTTTVGVINGVHRYTANFRAPAHPAAAARFSERNIFMLGVADLPDSRHTDNRNATNFTRGHSKLSVVTFFRYDLCKPACRANHLAALSWTHLDVMNLGTERNILDRQRIARKNIRILATQDCRIHLQPDRCDD